MTVSTHNKAVSEAVNTDALDHNDEMVKELRQDPDYAEIYLQTALEDINEPGGLGGFLIALRQVIEANGGITEASKKSGLARQHIYRALSAKGNPTITTLVQLAAVAGLEFSLRKSHAPLTPALSPKGRGGKQ
ncbi:helix-turn-helix domain-containing protein [Cedecea neteri]|uniref:helix-turn-helix domain-containing transcriptional regulator n=1 Tax=Cedecea neteri TaxID=158822 RepID=UPI002AA75E6A|nr:helix-turn-helix domain-containing protein [Cedecea neteri]WPU24350.1 helix-turn-helix domain-containing protein [Cedecea neteri]